MLQYQIKIVAITNKQQHDDIYIYIIKIKIIIKFKNYVF